MLFMWSLLRPQSWNNMEQGHGISVNYPPQAHVFKHLVPCRWHCLGRLWNLWDPGLSSGKWSLWVRLEGVRSCCFKLIQVWMEPPQLPHTPAGVDEASLAFSHSSWCGWNLPSCLTLQQVCMESSQLPHTPAGVDEASSAASHSCRCGWSLPSYL